MARPCLDLLVVFAKNGPHKPIVVVYSRSSDGSIPPTTNDDRGAMKLLPGCLEGQLETARRFVEHFRGKSSPGIFLFLSLIGCQTDSHDFGSTDVVRDERGYQCQKQPELSPCRWTKSDFTYQFGAPPPTMSRPDFEVAVDRAFAKWSSTGRVSFTRVVTGVDSDFIVDWKNESYVTTPIAHGDPPPGCFLELYPCRPKPITFYNRGPNMIWKDQGDVPDKNAYDVESIALHEIGHALGLHHCDNPIEDNCESAAEVMQERIGPGDVRRTLTPADLRQLRSRYQ